jgi:hypothetical protein
MILAIGKQLFNLSDELDGLNRCLYDHIMHLEIHVMLSMSSENALIG